MGRRAGTGISIFRKASQESLMSFTPGGTVRWMSPELLDPERFGKSDDRPTKGSDCYALGMVVYEVFIDTTILFSIDVRLSLVPIGSLRKTSLLGDGKRGASYDGHPKRESTEKTGGWRKPWAYQRVVGYPGAVLVE